MEKQKYYITTAIAYTSKIPHIGNTYEAVLADAIARYKRMTGFDVYFLTGTDEHGQKIEKQAESEGKTPQALVDEVSAEIRRIWDFMNVSYDGFIRTTDTNHKKVVQQIFKKLYEQGDIYKSRYEGWYCTPCESFFTDTQIVDGKCPECGREASRAAEEAYFLKLSKYADRLKEHIEKNPSFIQPVSRKNEMMNNFINAGLQDLCVSRTSFKWGVPVSFDDKHIVYVWIDALSNYITALGYQVDGKNDELFSKYWPADVHLIGKDILRFHTIYWPVILMALGLPLPAQVFGHPWLLFGEDKMSKSRGNVLYAEDLVSYFGVDAVRYYLLREMPFAQDGTITYELMISRMNSDLANILGNLVNRTVAMAQKYFDGVVPSPHVNRSDTDKDLITLALALAAAVESKMAELRVADALEEIFSLFRRANKYIDETTPWSLAKDEADRARLQTVIYNLLEAIRFGAVMLSPFLPETAEKIFAQLGNPPCDLSSLEHFGGLIPRTTLTQPQPLFARIDENEKLAEIEKYLATKQAKEEPKKELSPQISGTIGIEDFKKVQMVVAEILECEAVPKSDKLLRLILDDGSGKRQVVSGIAKWYTPNDLIGKKVLLVANLAPVKLRGVESNGMIIAATEADGSCKVIFADSGIENGAVLS